MRNRRPAAAILLAVAIIAVAAFGLGITSCIDWGGASAPPHLFAAPDAPGLSPP
jgi:hypothetical protein